MYQLNQLTRPYHTSITGEINPLLIHITILL